MPQTCQPAARLSHRPLSHPPLMAGEGAEQSDWLSLERSLRLSCQRQRAFACLRNLACLCRWWPQATKLQPLPPGLCQRGDLAWLQWRGRATLLKVLDYQPDRRIVLSLRPPDDILLLDMQLHSTLDGCRLRLRLETARRDGLLAGTQQALCLTRLLERASRQLEAHLRWELQSASP